MDPSPPPSQPSSPSSRPSKVMMQRQYREKEGECFVILRDIIKELTGDELQTRQEILKKAIEMLLSLSETRRQRSTEIVPSAATYEDPPLTDPAEMALLAAHLCYTPPLRLTSSPPFYFPYTTQSGGEFDLCNASTYSQRCHSLLMSNTDLAVEPNSYQGYCEDGYSILASHPVDEILDLQSFLFGTS